jgi:hypothetical protein
MKRNGKPTLAQTAVACLLILFVSTVAYGGSLQDDFDKLCIQTQGAEDLAREKIQELITECDQLRKKIEESNDEKKKLLLFRLNKCRNFFVYVFELKQASNPGSPK